MRREGECLLQVDTNTQTYTQSTHEGKGGVNFVLSRLFPAGGWRCETKNRYPLQDQACFHLPAATSAIPPPSQAPAIQDRFLFLRQTEDATVLVLVQNQTRHPLPRPHPSLRLSLEHGFGGELSGDGFAAKVSTVETVDTLDGGGDVDELDVDVALYNGQWKCFSY